MHIGDPSDEVLKQVQHDGRPSPPRLTAKITPFADDLPAFANIALLKF